MSPHAEQACERVAEEGVAFPCYVVRDESHIDNIEAMSIQSIERSQRKGGGVEHPGLDFGSVVAASGCRTDTPSFSVEAVYDRAGRRRVSIERPGTVQHAAIFGCTGGHPPRDRVMSFARVVANGAATFLWDATSRYADVPRRTAISTVGQL